MRNLRFVTSCNYLRPRSVAHLIMFDIKQFQMYDLKSLISHTHSFSNIKEIGDKERQLGYNRGNWGQMQNIDEKKKKQESKVSTIIKEINR